MFQRELDFSYFDRAIADFQGLNLYSSEEGARKQHDDPASWRLGGLYWLLAETGSIRPQELETFEPLTDLGEKALELTNQGATFSLLGRLTVCGEAEHKLLENIHSWNNSMFSTSRAPLIITKNGQPIGVLKNKGERSCYGLATDLESGLVEGCFSEPDEDNLLGSVRLPDSNRAWALPLEEAGHFVPRRFSTFTVPALERFKLRRHEDRSWAKEVLVSDHSDVARRISKLLGKATQLEVVPGSLTATV